MEYLQNIDFKLLKYIYLHRINDADKFLIWISQNTTFITIILILLIITISKICSKKELQKKSLLMTVSIISTAIIVNLLKLLIARPRAYDIYQTIIVKVDSGGYSFPSGHTAEVFALATTVFLLINNKPLKLLTVVWALLIAYTRIALGAHYPGDVLGGIIIGILIPYYTVKFLGKYDYFKIY